jgi:hypothetical protein
MKTNTIKRYQENSCVRIFHLSIYINTFTYCTTHLLTIFIIAPLPPSIFPLFNHIFSFLLLQFCDPPRVEEYLQHFSLQNIYKYHTSVQEFVDMNGHYYLERFRYLGPVIGMGRREKLMVPDHHNPGQAAHLGYLQQSPVHVRPGSYQPSQ